MINITIQNEHILEPTVDENDEKVMKFRKPGAEEHTWGYQRDKLQQ